MTGAAVMQTPLAPGACWSTASFGDATGTLPMELSALGEHLDLCRGHKGRLFELQRAAQHIQAFVMSRVVTSLALTALLIAVASMAF